MKTRRALGGAERRWIGLLVDILLFVAGVSLGMAFAPFSPPGGDTQFMGELAAMNYMEIAGAPIFYFRSPITIWIHQVAYAILSPCGFDGAYAVALCSSMAGGLMLVVLRHWRRGPLFWPVNLCSSATLLYFGHVENYAWVSVALLAYFLAADRCLEGKGSALRAALVLYLACALHLLALFYLPTLLLLVLRRRGGSEAPLWRKSAWELRVARKEMEWILVGFVAFALFMAGGSALGFYYGSDNNLSRLAPWGRVVLDRHLFRFLDPAHIALTGRFLVMASPIGIPLLLVAWGRRRVVPPDRPAIALLFAASLCAMAFAWLWHPDMAEFDWDLFATAAIPVNLLAGVIWSRRKPA